ncbi:MAG: glycerol kinase [Devosia nanyangense]|uniref:ATP:glycerol 3-phosphotransferase n=1 Tax=Devosia nanyangense TaxID=1228055 RepID=A0A933KZ92_9HYPH|nr:glycerol kinase [Devosia nanyangense]
MRVAGIDQGTTSTKGLVVDEAGEFTALPALVHKQYFPAPGWVEHSAEELLDNVRTALSAAASLGVRSFGLANQGETVVAWDRDSGRPLAPAIVWQDQRTSAEIARMVSAGHAQEVTALSGLPLDSYFSASKLRWLLDNAPGARELARRGRLGLGTSDSFFIERLTGRYVTDVTTAARTSLMNLETSSWDETLCALFGVPMELLPAIAAGDGPLGEVRTEAGIVTLQAAAVDQIAALYGHGCRDIGDGKITVGTGAFALVISGFTPPVPRAGIVTSPGWRRGAGRAYASDGAVHSAAAAIEWLGRIGLLTDLSEIERLDGASAAERDLFFVPALAGLACPHWDRSATGLFIGIDSGTAREDMIKAVLEGVAFRIAEVLLALDPAGRSERPIPADGGLMRSRYFAQFLADVVERPIVDRSGVEVTALGVTGLGHAQLAGADPGGFDLPVTGPVRTIEPRALPGVADLRSRFGEALERSTGWRR